MHIIATLAVLLLAASHALAQGVNTSIIKQRAREVSGSKQPPLPPPPPAPPAPGAAARPSAAQMNQAVVSKLSATIATIKIRSEVADEHRQKLAKDLAMAAQTGVVPPADALNKLADHLASAIVGGKFSANDQLLLARNLAALLGSKDVSGESAAALLASTRDTLMAAGASEEKTRLVLQDLQSLTATASKSK